MARTSMACGIGHQADDDANNATFEKPANSNSKPVKKPAVKPAEKKAAPVKKAPEKPAPAKPAPEKKPATTSGPLTPASYAKIKDEDGAMEVANLLIAGAKETKTIKELMDWTESNAPAKQVLADDWEDPHSVVVKAYSNQWDVLSKDNS